MMKAKGAPRLPHGTRACYQRHLRRREVPCEPCTDANARYNRHRRGRPAPGDVDLYPLIGLLAGLMLGDEWRYES